MQKRGPGSVLDSKSSLRLTAVALPFVAIIIIQAVLATFSLQMVTSLRAYVAGESLWSTGQHDAIYYLNRYIDTAEPVYLDRHQRALAVPLGDRAARLALEQQPPDRGAAFDGFAQGGNHPADIPGLIWLFENFAWFSYMQDAVTDWRNAEPILLQLEELAHVVEAEPEASPLQRRAWKARLDQINDEVTPLTRQFSTTLGQGARFVQFVLLAANLAIAALFVGLTFWRLGSFVRHRRAIEEELAWRASHDDLTKLPNRSAFEHELSAALGDGSAQALMFIDLDQFKLVNDTAGHAAGDRLLCSIADILTVAIDEHSMAARLGGDEFGVLVRGGTVEGGLKMAHRLCDSLAGLPFLWKDRHFTVSASIGFVALEGTEHKLYSAMMAADIACYAAKRLGRNRVHIHGGSEPPPDEPERLRA